ncbi:MAG: DUF4445 domain-containing protein, partial [Chitinivibrionales bacterium]|nr:DUF4445 domain-containing protein [Chitinivibrionales bacterium]
MPIITFTPAEARTSADPGDNLLDIARKAGVMIETPCGGQGTCGRCTVRVVTGALKAGDGGSLTRSEIDQGYVLACRATVGEHDVTIEVPGERAAAGGGQFAESHGEESRIPREYLPQTLAPLCRTKTVEVAPAALEDGFSDADRLACALRGDEAESPQPTLYALRELASALRADNGRVTVSTTGEGGQQRAIAIEPATGRQVYGVALDIGTTTVALQLVRLADGEVVSTSADYNGQLECGLDVISRINYARRAGGVERLRDRITDTINHLIRRALSGTDIADMQVRAVSLAGNTTMLHLLLGLDPEHIRLEPYTPTVLHAPLLCARDLGIEAHPEAPVWSAPAVGSYVGGDIVSGLLCTPPAHGEEALCLYLDIGTNGEVVVGNADFLMTCACSAGPAFEGGGIDCGMRAARGAVDHVEVNASDGTPRVSVIGGGAPSGICGTGIISLLAALYRTGWLDGAGKLARDRQSPAIRIDGRRARYVFSDEESELSIGEIDIENVLRAKAAVYAACCLMLDQVGVGFDDIARVFIAGGFGRYMDIESAVTLGLLPDIPRERYSYVGNASLAGARFCLLSAEHRRLAQHTASRMTYLELNTDPTYMDRYTA